MSPFRAILFILDNPDPFKKAQNELDQVVGPSRLPSLDDRPNLPYFEALMAELMRRANVAPFAIFHENKEEAYISGYRYFLSNLNGIIISSGDWSFLSRIPPGTQIAFALTEVLHDPK